MPSTHRTNGTHTSGGQRLRAAFEDFRRAARSLERDVRRVRTRVAGPSGAASRVHLPRESLIPRREHLVLDWAAGATAFAPVLFATTRRGTWASALLGGGVLALAGIASRRPRAALPFDSHRNVDLGFGAAFALSPLVLGYIARDPPAAIVHLAAGATMVSNALLTDYTAAPASLRPEAGEIERPASTGGPVL